MTCYTPLIGYRRKDGTFSPRETADSLGTMEVPCGSCTGCRLDRSRDWAVRCVHEAQLHLSSEYVTLTYRDDALPWDRSLRPDDFRLFVKRVRKKYPGVRYFQCGEYGGKFGRPHHHALMFNWYLKDRKFWKTVNGYDLYTSQELESLWQHGFCTMGAVSFTSAAYVSRYIMKKITGRQAESHYRTEFMDRKTGELIQSRRMAEYNTMSRRPGIASRWFDLYWRDVFPNDYVVLDGKKMPVPRYYLKKLADMDKEMYLKVIERREDRGIKEAWNQTRERLEVRHTVKKAQTSTLKRDLE